MNAPLVIETLAAAGVMLYLDGDKLKFLAPRGAYSHELRELVAAHRAAVVEVLRKQTADSSHRQTASHSCSRSDWTDSPALDRPGWIRTTCRECGRFIGYRPADGKPRTTLDNW